MIEFIQQEAAEKIEEIEIKDEEEFNIAKSHLISQQCAKIIEYYDKKEEQIELQRKIQHSTLANANHLFILQVRDDYVQALKEEARKQLIILTKDRAKYITILANLITQGLVVLMEPIVTIRCRHDDYGLVKRLIPDASRRYKRELKEKDIIVIVDDENFLPDDM
jgi:V-type H+-transporting ATPase subunit E